MSHVDEPILSGIVTEIKLYNKFQTARIVLDKKLTAFVSKPINPVLLGSRLSLVGHWKQSRKYGRVFWSDTYRLIDRNVGRKRNIPYLTRLFGKKQPDDRAIQTAERLEAILRPLIDMGRKTLARKIALSVKPEDALDIRDNPYTLYFRKLIDFNMAEILAFLEYDIKKIVARDHPDRLNAAVREVLLEAYESGMSCLDMTDLKNRVMEKTAIDIDIDSIKLIRKDVAVFEYDHAYLPKIYYLRLKTLQRLSEGQEETSLMTYQNEDINTLLGHRYSILTGAAGTGKTTVIKQLSKLYDGDVAITALTGKAASLYGDDSQTLHRLLGYGNKGFSVKSLNYDLVVVDEASMLDWHITFALFRAAKGRVILAGDANQLPPVKGGSVFAELLAVLPVVTLEKVHRFIGGENNVVCYKRETDRQLIGSVISLSRKLKEAGEDFQVITPVKGDMIGTFRLNNILQKYLNPNGSLTIGQFRIGDRVIVTKNCYRKEVPAFNGQVGHIVEKDDERPRSVYVELQNGHTLPFYENEIDLAYCLTVHKAQGSQFNRVIFVSPESKYEEFIDDNMVYTGTTRGIKKTYVFKV